MNLSSNQRHADVVMVLEFWEGLCENSGKGCVRILGRIV